MSSGIFYYSRSNNTRTGAQILAQKCNGELVELLETKGRRGMTGFLKSGFQAVTGKKSELQGEPWTRMESFDKVYLMTPIWGGKGTPAMNRLVDEADFNGKDVTVITFQSDAKGEGSKKVHDLYKARIEGSGGRFLAGIALHSALPGKFAGKEHIEAQINKIAGH